MRREWLLRRTTSSRVSLQSAERGARSATASATPRDSSLASRILRRVAAATSGLSRDGTEDKARTR